MSLNFRWLGVAGLHLFTGDASLLIDPFFTRPPAYRLLPFYRAESDRLLIARHTTPAEYILVTHPHYDHLMDVPAVMQITGARTFGSPNTCRLLEWCGIARERYTDIKIGDQLDLGPFHVEVFPANHTHTPIDRWLNGSLPPNLPAADGKLPRLIDYRMDACFSFRISVDGKTLLVGNHPSPADILFISPYQQRANLHAILSSVSPELIIPIHWDDFTRPLSQSLRPMLITRQQGLPGWFPVGRLNLDRFARLVHELCPNAVILIPGLFQAYPLQG